MESSSLISILFAQAPHALANAVLVILAMASAAVAHLLWLKSGWSKSFAQPLDGGRTWRGKRLFGDNKRVCGLLMLPPAAALAFAALSGMREVLPPWLSAGLWNESTLWHAALGFLCGLAFMLAELPNSFVKRQLDVAPGGEPQSKLQRRACAFVDRMDSTLAVLLVCQLLTNQPWQAAVFLLAMGISVHAMFSVIQFAMGLKGRAF